MQMIVVCPIDLMHIQKSWCNYIIELFLFLAAVLGLWPSSAQCMEISHSVEQGSEPKENHGFYGAVLGVRTQQNHDVYEAGIWVKGKP